MQELEAENACQDDDNDFESLSGNAITIWNAVSGKVSAVSTIEIEAMLDKNDMWSIPKRYRGAVFNFMVSRAKAAMQDEVRKLAVEYQKSCQRFRYGGFENDAIVLRQQKIIGVTTTGLSKYRGLIAGVRPRVVMIEEAAETMEPPVTAGCVPTLEHLILVGDHKQLRPQCGVKGLERPPFDLNVSLFERLVNNDLPYKMLKKQRRMIPEIRRLLGPIYRNDINDHITMRSPKERLPIPGMGGVNSFFMTHTWQEARDDQMSCTNIQEADMVVGMYDYLISNGMTEDQITVLTFYNGQRKLILRQLRHHTRLGYDSTRIFKVVTVDSYQGEENDVVLLSLVRSNDEGKVGFLDVENRVCVALSRAKRGFYMFGNAELLVGESKLWAKVINVMLADKSVIETDRAPVSEPHGRLVFRVPVRCQKHGGRVFIEAPDDWTDIDGGCLRLCGEIKKCGHVCSLKCHPFGHGKVVCALPCVRKLSCGHLCVRKCMDECFCPTCGNNKHSKRLSQISNGLSANSSGNESSGGSNVLAWQDFAKGGHRAADRALVEQQRERFLQDQITQLSPQAVKENVPQLPPNSEPPVFPIPATTTTVLPLPPVSAPVTAIRSEPEPETSTANGPLVPSIETPPTQYTGPPAKQTIMTSPAPKPKVSAGSRFKHKTGPAPHVAPTPAPAPPVGYIPGSASFRELGSTPPAPPAAPRTSTPAQSSRAPSTPAPQTTQPKPKEDLLIDLF